MKPIRAPGACPCNARTAPQASKETLPVLCPLLPGPWCTSHLHLGRSLTHSRCWTDMSHCQNIPAFEKRASPLASPSNGWSCRTEEKASTPPPPPFPPAHAHGAPPLSPMICSSRGSCRSQTLQGSHEPVQGGFLQEGSLC